jgi:hypothetical protein
MVVSSSNLEAAQDCLNGDFEGLIGLKGLEEIQYFF